MSEVTGYIQLYFSNDDALFADTLFVSIIVLLKNGNYAIIASIENLNGSDIMTIHEYTLSVDFFSSPIRSTNIGIAAVSVRELQRN